MHRSPLFFAFLRAHRRLLGYLALATVLESAIVSRVFAAVAGGAPPLDDVMIHFQYARTIAIGEAFRFGGVDDPRSSGATSVAYACLLAVPWALGLRRLHLLFAAYAYGAIGWGFLAEGMHRIGEKLWGPLQGIGAGILTFTFAGIAWHACSAMETIPAMAIVAWTLALSLEVDRPKTLAALGLLAPMVRADLMPLSLVGATALMLRGRDLRTRTLGVVALAGVGLQPLFWKIVTGTAQTNGSAVKWILSAPYLTRTDRWNIVRDNAEQIRTLALGGVRANSGFFPEHAWGVMVFGILVLFVRQLWRGRLWQATVVLGGAALMAVPLTYHDPLAHRARYLFPMAVIWLQGIVAAGACAAIVVSGVASAIVRSGGRAGGRARRIDEPSWRWALGVGAAVALCTQRFELAVDDLVSCGAQILGQQGKLAEMVGPLPTSARILLNDAGAIAYLGGHPTIDLIGLTTQGMAASWRAGTGSRFEAIEALPIGRRPTHAAIYDFWWGVPEILGPRLGTAFVANSTILGTGEAILYPIRTELYDSGAAPLEPIAADERVVDEVDVADLSSERAHDYDDLDDGAGDDLARLYRVQGREVLDGGRVVRHGEQFHLAATAGCRARLIVRTDAWFPGAIDVAWNGVTVGAVQIEVARKFVDLPLVIAADRVRADNAVSLTLREGGNYGSFHHFLVQPALACVGR